jgi:L-ascorbate metabolism protein UlaG (beta-lactamase superfamily)
MLQPAKQLGRKFQNPVPTSVGSLSMMLKIFWLYATNREERVPRRQLGPFHTNARVYESAPASGLRVTWMGHSTALIEIDGFRVMTDPLWDERASPLSGMGPKRFFAAPLSLEVLPPIDAIVLSHDHYDHLGKRTIPRLAASAATRSAQWVTSLGVGKLLRDYGVAADRVLELNWTESTHLESEHGGSGLTITALPSRHFSGRSLWNRFETLWSSFAIRGERHAVYFGADSGLWDGFAEIGREYGPFDLTMLDTGAYNDLWKDIHMGPQGAVEAFRAMGGAGLLMPIHWGLFDLALHDWRQPIRRITELADELGIALWSPEPGVPTEVVDGVEHRAGWWRTA